jgi:hypothetical protein
VIKLATALLVASTSTFAIAQSFMPENQLHLNPIMQASMSKAEFDAVMDKALKVYGPIIKDNFGKKFNIEREWNNDTVNAYAYQSGSNWNIHMYGGLARRVTSDGFLGVICHELGHHLGGAPIKSWATNEGGSDYFVSRCMRNIVGHETETAAKAAALVNKTAKSKCDEVYSNEGDRNFCYRVMNGAKSLADLLGGRSGATSFETKDRNVVSVTYDMHPRAQCRLDTYVASALCSKMNETWDDAEIPGKGMSKRSGEMESSNYTCNTFQGDDAMTVRPRCWFAPLVK